MGVAQRHGPSKESEEGDDDVAAAAASSGKMRAEPRREREATSEEKLYSGPAFTMASPDPTQTPLTWLLLLPLYVVD